MPRLVSIFLQWLLLLLAVAPASAVMDVQPRNHAWEPSASSYDLAPDVRDGPNLYAYVKQNPWTSFDPLGLAEESVVVKAIKERSALVAQTYENAGRQDGANAQRAKFERGQAAASAMAGGMNELVSNTPIGAANEAFTGVNAMGDPLSAGERLAVLAGFVPAGKFAGRLGKAGVDALSSSAQEISKKADEIVDAIRKGGDGAAKKGGIYEFPDQKAGGTPYVGQSGDLASRLKKHESSGRLKPGTEATTEVAGGKTVREIAEHKRIQEMTGGIPASKSDAVSNKVDPIGPKRQHLLDEE